MITILVSTVKLIGRWHWIACSICDNQWLGRFLSIIGWDPSVGKSNRLHVDILWFSFIKLGYIPYIPLKWSVIFLESWSSTGSFSNSIGSSVTNCRFSPIIGDYHSRLNSQPNWVGDLYNHLTSTGISNLRMKESIHMSSAYLWGKWSLPALIWNHVCHLLGEVG